MTTIQESFIKLKNSTQTITYLESNGKEFTETYASLFHRSLTILGGLQSQGIKKGDFLVFQFKSIRSQISTFWAGILGGMVPAILPLAYDKKSNIYLKNALSLLDHPFIISDLHGVTTILHPNLLMYPLLNHNGLGKISHVSKDDPGMIQFTSGTSSQPKGAILTQNNLYEGGLASSIIVRENIQERYLNWLPLSHCFGFVGYHLVPIVNNFSQYHISTTLFIQNPNIWLEKLSSFSATVSGAALFGIEHLLRFGIKNNSSLDLSSIYICFCGGEDTNPHSLLDFEKQTKAMGWTPDTLKPAYGLSETTMGVSYTPYGYSFRVDHFLGSGISIGKKLFFCSPDNDTISRVSVGVLDECNEVVIKDLSGKILANDYLGIVHIKGSNVMKGYYSKDSEENSSIDDEGWFNTGDLGFFHKKWLTIFGRYKDILIINGENYLASDLEKTGKQSLSDQSSLVLIQGMNRTTQKNELVLFSTTSNPTLLKKASSAIGSTWNIPIQWGILINTIPQTPSGKTDHLKLSSTWENGEYLTEAISLHDPTFSTLQGLYKEMADNWSEILKLPNTSIALEHHFIFDLGGDSLSLFDLIYRIETKYDIIIDSETIFDQLTLKEMTDYIHSLR
jgi:acyl carrier protein